MLGIFKRKKKDSPVAKTFLEATGGGWSDPPDTVSGDGGDYAHYVDEVLRKARDYIREQGIEIGERFKFRIDNIPTSITSPHEIVIGIMMGAHEYGLSAGTMMDEVIFFTRVE